MQPSSEKHAYPESNLYPQVNPPPYNEEPPQSYAPPPQPYAPPPQPYVPPPQPYEPPPQPHEPSAPKVGTVSPGVTVVQGGVVGMVVRPAVGPHPANITCPSCNHQITTTVEYTPATKTHIIALLLCLIGCWVCACIPYCVDSCQSAQHYCPNCSAYIGAYQS